MSRARLRKALAARSESDPAIVLLVESHAARLEQLLPERWLCDPEPHAKMLRSAQALYGFDAVPIGRAGRFAADACRLAAAPGLGAIRARADTESQKPLRPLPDPETIASTAPVTLASDVLRRLRAVLAERSGIVVTIPDPTRLAADLGAPGEVNWAGEVIAVLLRTLGPEEPDAIFLLGNDDPVDPTLETLAEFYGAPLVPIGQASPPGLVVLSTQQILSDVPPAPAWLYTTAEEIPPATDPQPLRAAIDRLRRRLEPPAAPR